MKRFLVIAVFCGLLLPVHVARADGPDDDYLGIYSQIQEADMFAEQGNSKRAVTKYTEALHDLKSFQTNYPTWNPNIVNFRLRYLVEKIETTRTNLPPAAPTQPGATPTPAPAAPDTKSSTAPSAPSAAPAPAPAAPASPGASMGAPNAPAEPDGELESLREQVQRLTAERDSLQAKLKEALAARPAEVDPAELAKANEHIRSLEKENDLLKANLDLAKSQVSAADVSAMQQVQHALQEATQKVTALTQENAELMSKNSALQARVKSAPAVSAPSQDDLRAENEVLKKELAALKSKTPTGGKADVARQLLAAQAQVAALQSDKEMLELAKTALEQRLKTVQAASANNSAAPATAEATSPALDAATQARIRQLESERDQLQKRLDAAQQELRTRQTGVSASTNTSQVEELSRELTGLRSRLDVLEARRVPYTDEELALFRTEPATLMAAVHHVTPRPTSDMPPVKDVNTLLSEAQTFYTGHQYDKAEEKFLEILKQDPDNIVVLGDLAMIAADAGHLDQAELYVRQALGNKPNDAFNLGVLGRIQMQQGKYDNALDSLSRAAQEDPRNAQIQNYLGLTLSHKGLRGPAESALRKAIELDPNLATAHSNLAVVYASQNPPLLELARWHYQKALNAGMPRNEDLEKLLDGTKTADASH